MVGREGREGREGRLALGWLEGSEGCRKRRKFAERDLATFWKISEYESYGAQSGNLAIGRRDGGRGRVAKCVRTAS